MKQIKIGAYLLGVSALIFTVLYIVEVIQLAGRYIIWWTLILQWPMSWYSIFINPLSLLYWPVLVRILVAVLSPFLALIVSKRLGYSPMAQALWFAFTFIFPFVLLIFATAPIQNADIIRNRLSVAAKTLLLGLFWAALGFFMLVPFSGHGDVVYVVGARWLGTDNPAVGVLIIVIGFLFAGLGIAGITSAILVTLGILKPETLERILRRFK